MTMRSMGWLGVAGLAGLAATVVIVQSGDDELCPPRWTEADLPPLPPAADNGWMQVVGPEAAALSIELGEATDPLIRFELEDLDDAERWQVIVDTEPAIRETLDLPANAEALRRWHAAIEAPHYANGCRLEPGEFCRDFQGYQLHQLVLVELMGLALRGDWELVNDRLVRILEVDQALVRTSRTLTSGMVATTGQRETLALTHALLMQQPAEASGPARQRLLLAVAGIDVTASVLEQGVVGNYVMGRNFFEHVETHGFEEVLGDDGWWPPHALYDATKTSEVHTALHEELMARAHGEHPKPVADWGWSDRVLNPMGVMLVDPESERRGVESARSVIEPDLEAAGRWCSQILARWDDPAARSGDRP